MGDHFPPFLANYTPGGGDRSQTPVAPLPLAPSWGKGQTHLSNGMIGGYIVQGVNREQPHLGGGGGYELKQINPPIPWGHTEARPGYPAVMVVFDTAHPRPENGCNTNNAIFDLVQNDNYNI